MKTMVFVAIGVALSMPGEVDSYDESVKRAYGYSNWCGRTRMDYPRLVQDWYLPDLSLLTNGINAVVEKLVYVDSKICGSVEDAHASVIEKFSNMTTTRIFPQVTNDIGDVLFHYRFNSGLDFAVFTRNNVFVWIDSRIGSCSATNIAKQVDVSILRASGVEP